jgi:predicted acetyltransferase
MKPDPRCEKDSGGEADDPEKSSRGWRSRVPYLFCLGPLSAPLHRWNASDSAPEPAGKSFLSDMSPEPHFAPPCARLVAPCLELRDSYVSLVAEFRERGEDAVPFVLDFPTEDFPSFLQKMRDCTAGLGLPSGFVAHETFWLVDDGEVVGVSNLRLSLTERLRKEGGHIGYGIRPSARRRGHATRVLALTIAKARERGIGDVLVTCDKANVASARTILKNGGSLDSEEFEAERGDFKQRYWIRAR